jgi:cytochrome P450
VTSDVFELKDKFYGIGSFADPYPRLESLQGQCPAHRGSLSGLFGTVGPDNMGYPEESYVSVLSFDEAEKILKNPSTFSASWYHLLLGEIIGRTILEMDPPEHRRFRMLLQKAFSRREVERWEARFIGDILDRAIDGFAGAGRADLARDYAFHYPIAVTAAAAGLPVVDIDAFYCHTAVLTNQTSPLDERRRASAELGELIQRLIDERRRAPQDDLISVLVTARLTDEESAEAGSGSRELGDDEVVAFMRLLIPAGAQTTYRAMCNLLFGLLTNPEQLDAVRADRSLIAQAVEEGLRWEVPLLFAGRTVTADTEVCGHAVAAGEHVDVVLGAANHDPTRWPDPHRFDIFRPQQRHLGFGDGVHVCLGIHLARAELRLSLAKLLDRLPDLRLDPDAEPPSITGLGMRTAVRLPVVFTPA